MYNINTFEIPHPWLPGFTFFGARVMAVWAVNVKKHALWNSYGVRQKSSGSEGQRFIGLIWIDGFWAVTIVDYSPKTTSGESLDHAHTGTLSSLTKSMRMLSPPTVRHPTAHHQSVTNSTGNMIISNTIIGNMIISTYSSSVCYSETARETDHLWNALTKAPTCCLNMLEPLLTTVSNHYAK